MNLRGLGNPVRNPALTAVIGAALGLAPLALPAAPAAATQPTQVAAADTAPAGEPSARRPVRGMMPAMLWSLLPGGGQIYLGNVGTGVSYAALTAAFVGLGAEVQRHNDELGRKDEVNVPELVGEKVWEYSIFSTFRSAAVANGIDLRAHRFDDTPTYRLMLAPFTPSQFLRPAVFGAMLLGVADAALAAHDAPGRLNDVDRAYMLGSDFNRNDATWLYAASDLSVSLGAGMAEEGLFRGTMQPILQERWGDTAGLWATAGTFGLAHIVGVDGSLNLGGVLFATGAGAYFGWLYDHDGARLAGPVAAHFWYDFAVFGASWVLDPNNTPFGFKVKFGF